MDQWWITYEKKYQQIIADNDGFVYLLKKFSAIEELYKSKN